MGKSGPDDPMAVQEKRLREKRPRTERGEAGAGTHAGIESARGGESGGDGGGGRRRMFRQSQGHHRECVIGVGECAVCRLMACARVER